MNRRLKLITSFAAVCIAFTMMCFGVYAAATPAITVTGTVSFTAENVLCTVTGKKGTGEPSAWATNLTTINYTVAATNAQTMAVGTITLTDSVVKGGYKITITSNFASGSATKIKITSTLPANVSKTGYTVTYAGDSAWTTATGTGLGGGASAVLTVTMTVDPTLAGASATQDIGIPSITLTRVG